MGRTHSLVGEIGVPLEDEDQANVVSFAAGDQKQIVGLTFVGSKLRGVIEESLLDPRHAAELMDIGKNLFALASKGQTHNRVDEVTPTLSASVTVAQSANPDQPPTPNPPTVGPGRRQAEQRQGFVAG